MSDQKNLFLAIGLSLLVLGVYQYFVEMPRLRAVAEQQKQAALLTAKKGSAGDSSLPLGTPDASLTPTAAQKDLSRREALADSPRITIDAPGLKGSLALKGARLDDVALKHYRQTRDKGSPPVELLAPAGTKHAYYADIGWLGGSGVTVPDSNTLWQANSTALTPQTPVTLHWENGQGLRFELTYAVDDKYLFTVTRRVLNNTAAPVTLFPYGALSRRGLPGENDYRPGFEGALGAFSGKLEERTYKKLQEDGDVTFKSTGGWAGVGDHYWLAALLPAAQQVSHEYAFRSARRGDNPVFQVDYREQGEALAPGATSEAVTRVFVGAKELSTLDAYSHQYNVPLFDRTINFGLFYFLTKPLFLLLHTLHNWLGNFGVAIILLTVLVRLSLAPLAHKSYVAINRMKTLQPRVDEIKERFSSDRMQMNQEIMKLYQKEKVNPMSGCLPVLLQIPVFFALYKVLLVSIEMRHAPFFGWIQDLAAPDPTSFFNLFGLLSFTPPSVLMIGVWPLLVGLTMWMSQRLNPTPPDPTQALMLKAFPFIFTYITAHFPAGLAVYWTFNNLFSALQQWGIKKMVEKKHPSPANALVTMKK